jgi:hypothetical protein
MSFAAALARLRQPEHLLLPDRQASAKHGIRVSDYGKKANRRPI